MQFCNHSFKTFLLMLKKTKINFGNTCNTLDERERFLDNRFLDNLFLINIHRFFRVMRLVRYLPNTVSNNVRNVSSINSYYCATKKVLCNQTLIKGVF